jgi:hypothetical protein
MIRYNLAIKHRVFFLTSFIFFLFSIVHSQSNSIDLVKKLSDSHLIVSELHELVGDFNEDGIKDLAVIVKLDQPTISGVYGIKSYFKVDYLCGSPIPCGDEIEPESSSLLIIHGKTKGWELKKTWSFKMKSAILLRGRSNVYAFQKSRFSEKISGMKIVKGKNGKVWLEFSTEASEGILKWKAGKYTWYETEP